ncbi:odorant receptor 49b-like [Solenopsis invicta]|uniref:odorant receptor 49b-like n=1 Tax=Solenopsis invicta TaxID=13686 RepID=UPI00193CD6C1|nr:odorant receptor 49b-like [Solenopsis invicta]
MMTSILQNITQENEILIYKGMIYAIDIHRKATQFSQHFLKIFEGPFFFIIASGMISFSCTLVEIVSINNFEEFIPFSIIILTVFLYMIMANYTAQEVMDHNNRVFATAYNVQWYIAPLRIQKMLIFLLLRGNKAFNLNLGGLFVGSLESAAMLTSASITYFTVLYSLR